MRYLSRKVRNEIADVLTVEHNMWVRYRDEQEPHPKKGINIKRGSAEIRIKRLRELIALVSPKPTEQILGCRV